MKISPLSKRNRKTSRAFEHIMIFIVSFVSIYGIVLFMSMRSRSGNLMDDFAKNQLPFILGTLIVAAFINLFYYLFNKGKVLIMSVNFNNENLILEMRTFYSETLKTQTIPYNNLKHTLEKHNAFFLGYEYSVISFYDEKRLVGVINTAENWDGETLSIRQIMDELKRLAVQKNKP